MQYPTFSLGIRGEVHIKVMVEIIKDLHKHSSSEITFFSGQFSIIMLYAAALQYVQMMIYSFIDIGLVVPDGFSLEAIQGFLEELVVNDDPEYQVYSAIIPFLKLIAVF